MEVADSFQNARKGRRRIEIDPTLITVIYNSALNEGDSPVYQCKICTCIFKNKSYIRYHEYCKTGEKKRYKCNQCTKDFFGKQQYQAHVRTHTGERPYKCPTCGKGFTMSKGLKSHMEVHVPDRKFRCEQCKRRSFQTLGDLQRHIQVHVKRRFPCTVCGRLFAVQVALKNHLREHFDEKSILCRLCGVAFGNDSNLQLHLKTHNESLSLQRDDCNKRLATQTDTQRKDRIQTDESFLCRVCGLEFTNDTNLQMHLKIRHELLPPQCDKYNKGFLTRKEIQNEEYIQSRTVVYLKDEGSFSDRVCEVEFGNNSKLQLHLKTPYGLPPPKRDEWNESPTDEGSYLDSGCGVEFGNNSNLQPQTHYVSLPPQRADCNEGYFTRTDTQMKERLQTGYDFASYLKGEESYLRVCGVEFRSDSNLQSHLKTHHELLSPQWGDCNGELATRTYTQREERTQIGERPFVCGICGSRYAQKHHLSYHLEAIHDFRKSSPMEHSNLQF